MLGKFEVRGVLGRGAMGVVYDGWDPAIARRVAIKVVRIPDDPDEEATAQLLRFRQEGQAAGRLNHPNVVGVYDVGEAVLEGEKVAYIAMEFVEGRSLRATLEGGNRLALPHIRRLMGDLLAGLGYSHGRGVVHRDIKPDNLIITQDDTLKIADFGIARIENSSLTQVGTIMGTPSYMSPEQFTGQPLDARTDLYSSGVVLYQLLTGEKPFTGTMSSIMHKALNVEPPPASGLAPSIPAGLDAVVARAMAKRPEDRFADARAFLASLNDAFEQRATRSSGNQPVGIAAFLDAEDDEATTIRAAPPPWQQLRPANSSQPARTRGGGGRTAVLAGGAAAIVVLLGAGGVFLFGDRAARQSTPVVPLPGPPPAITPFTPPVVAPSVVKPPAQPATIPADTIAAVRNAVGHVACSFADADPSADGTALRITGIAGDGGPARALFAAAGPHPVQDDVARVTGPYCPLLDMLRPLAGPQNGLDAAVLGTMPLRRDELLRLRVTAPVHETWLAADYVESDGTVYHLLETPHQPHEPVSSGSTTMFGDPVPGFAGWPVSAPFGRDLLVVTAADTDAFAHKRPFSEDRAAYIAALRTTLAELQAHHHPASVVVIPVDTADAP